MKCIGVTKSGLPCSRNSASGSTACWQHKELIRNQRSDPFQLYNDIYQKIGQFLHFKDIIPAVEAGFSKKLYLGVLCINTYTNKLSYIRKKIPQITDLEVHWEVSIADLYIIQRFVSLKALTFSPLTLNYNFGKLKYLGIRYQFDREIQILTLIQSIPTLEHLNIINIPYLQSNEKVSVNLQTLEFSNSAVDRYDGFYESLSLKHFPNLRRLICPVIINSQELEYVQNLEMLEIYNDKILEKIIEKINPNIKALQFVAEFENPWNIQFLTFQSLEYLGIAYSFDFLNILSILPQFNNLQYVNIKIILDSDISNTNLSKLKNLKAKKPHLIISYDEYHSTDLLVGFQWYAFQKLFNLPELSKYTERYYKPKYKLNTKNDWLRNNNFYIKEKCDNYF
jgi:hypothetical protein